MTKNRLKRGENCNTYLTHVCRQLWSLERSERTDREPNYQSTLWLSSAVEVDIYIYADESYSVG